ncbi:FprA family A-type flavoprotein [Oscillibacter sp.]|uniref:FprA family A-type flavoprotein n=1 Tax=Oscillibacter sp. TaxID=1945593 RepID=UPI002635CEFC|nr:FprA family A-type flavoprotein [Oscillibacter sp.]MDD3347536.1 FprA family A-type flavoprotein [Oscillibacter sp.]
MHCVRTIAPDVLYVGGSDRRLALFENIYPIPRGVSYNAYLVLDEKTVLLDTVDKSVGERFFENLEYGLQGRMLDYVVVNHMEPDHAATLSELLRRYPDVEVVGSVKTMSMIDQFFGLDLSGHSRTVKEGDTLISGHHTFTFAMAPMVHWPEVMVTYDTTEKILFSADAFGTFGALGGNLFADELDFQGQWLPDARRYYANIVGKYGVQVQSLLKKAAGLDIAMVCPLHGPIWRKDIGWFVEKYQRWSTYTPEEKGVFIACASVYGNTENAAEIVAARLAENGVREIALYDLSQHPVSDMVGEAFRFSHLVLAASTYNNGIFTPMENLLLDLKAHNFQRRTVALIENGSWAPQSGKLMAELVGSMKEMTVLQNTVTLKSTAKEDQRAALEALADALAADILS